MSQINIVGAGLSGLSFAIKARLNGENVTLFDKSAAPIMSPGLSSNVLSINKRSARFLESLGVLDRLEDSSRTNFHENRWKLFLQASWSFLNLRGANKKQDNLESAVYSLTHRIRWQPSQISCCLYPPNNR